MIALFIFFIYIFQSLLSLKYKLNKAAKRSETSNWPHIPHALYDCHVTSYAVAAVDRNQPKTDVDDSKSFNSIGICQTVQLCGTLNVDVEP